MFLSFSSHKYTTLKYIGWHHFLYIASYMPIPNIDVGEASSLPILCKDFVLVYMEKMGVSHSSALISPVQRLTQKYIGQRQVNKRMEIGMEKDWWPHLFRPFCQFLHKS